MNFLANWGVEVSVSIEKDILQCFRKEKLDNVQKQVEMNVLFQVNSGRWVKKVFHCLTMKRGPRWIKEALWHFLNNMEDYRPSGPFKIMINTCAVAKLRTLAGAEFTEKNYFPGTNIRLCRKLSRRKKNNLDNGRGEKKIQKWNSSDNRWSLIIFYFQKLFCGWLQMTAPIQGIFPDAISMPCWLCRNVVRAVFS